MRLPLDTHILIGLSRDTLSRTHANIVAGLIQPGRDICISVASLWEIAIKSRLGKLDVKLPLDQIAVYFATLGMAMLPIEQVHVIADIDPEPGTRDPFDRLLLAQCGVEKRRLVTVDRTPVGHPLAISVF